MSAATTAPLPHDFRVISLIGVAHGASHFYQLAFATMLLIVRQEVGLSFADVGLLAGIFYGVSGLAQTAAGFAVDRFGARPILAGGLFVVGLGLACISVAHSFVGFAGIAVIAGLGNSVFHPADFALLNSSVNTKLINPGPAISVDANTSETSPATSSTRWAMSRGVEPSALARANAPFACASARSLGRTTGSQALPATAAKAGARRAAMETNGSAMVYLFCRAQCLGHGSIMKCHRLTPA